MHNSIMGILCKEGRVKADKNILERKVFVWTSGILHITHMYYKWKLQLRSSSVLHTKRMYYYRVIVDHKKMKIIKIENYKKWNLQLWSSSVLHTKRMYYYRVIVDHKKMEITKIENYNCDLAAYYTLNACITTALLSITKNENYKKWKLPHTIEI